MTNAKYNRILHLCVTLLMLGCVIFTAVLPVAAISYPKQDDRIADEAGVLSESTIRELKEKNKDLSKDVGATIAVCTVKTTGDTKIDEYARGLFKEWKLGEGILLLIAVDDNNYYLIQSVGVDKIITNEVLTAVRNDYLEADFAAGNIDRGVKKTINRLDTLLIAGLEDAVSEDEEASDDDQTDTENKGTTFGSIIVGFFKLVLILALIVIVLFAALFVAALFNDDCAEIFSNIWQNFILRKGNLKGKKNYTMPEEYYDERLYGNRQNAQRRSPNRQQYQQLDQRSTPRLPAGQQDRRYQQERQSQQYNGQPRRNTYYNADGTPRLPIQNQNPQNNARPRNNVRPQNNGNQYSNSQYNSNQQYGSDTQFGDETRQFTIPGRGQNQR